jgi:Uma2 family endonuclease
VWLGPDWAKLCQAGGQHEEAAMTAAPQPPRPQLIMPDHLLTTAEYARLREPDSGYTELVEGRLVMSPSPTPNHNFASGRLLLQLQPQLPGHIEVIQDVDIDLGLDPPERPGNARRPDLVMIPKDARLRVGDEGGLLRASEVLVVIEIVSPGSKRTDRVTKRGEYADAGIPHYWIVDLEPPVSLLACHLAGEFGYADSGEFTGKFTATDPIDLSLDLDQLS